MAFQNSNSVDAHGSTFTDIHANQVNINQVIHTNPDLIPSLVPVPNSAENHVRPVAKATPLCSELFTGRGDYLETLRQYFSRRDVSSPRRRFLLHGMGGAGKTQICLKFVQEYSELFSRIFWVDATTVETIQLSLQDIAADPDARASGVERSADSVLQWLSCAEGEWLIVFDNADGDPSIVTKYFPRGTHGNILFTSRNQGLRRYVSREANAEVENMEEQDAVTLLLKSAFLDELSMEIKATARLIVKELCFFPLAVDQAGAAILSGLCNIDDYLRIYSEHRQQLLADPTFQGASNYGRAVYGTWDLSFQAIKAMDNSAAQCAIFTLQIFACFHHENITEEIFKRAAEASKQSTCGADDGNMHPLQNSIVLSQILQLGNGGRWDPFCFRKGIQILLTFSLIKKGATNSTYSMHPLVHCWTRDNMLLQNQHIMSYASHLLSFSIPLSITSEDYAFRQTLLPHIKTTDPCLGEVTLDIQQPINNDLYTKFALVFFENGHWKEAEGLYAQMMEMRKRVLGDEHPDTLSSMSWLASTYRNQGQWKEAEKLGVQVTEMTKRILGDEHPDTLSSMACLASIYRNQGQWKEAEKLCVQVMEMRKRVLGDEHPQTLSIMSCLASTYQNQGQWKEAEKLGVQVTEMRKRILGDEHPDTLSGMACLASTYRNQGQWKEAEKLCVQVMEMRKRVIGDEHPQTLSSMACLALIYRNQGQWKEAEKLGVQVTEMRKRILGDEHPDTLSGMSCLASTYRNQGQWKEAEKLCVQVMEMRKRIIGDEHPQTLSSMACLALIYRNQGQWKEAEKLCVQVMEMRKRVLGDEHPQTLSTMSCLASIYQNQGQWKEAEKLGVQVTEMRKRVLGDEHPQTLSTMSCLASTYENQGQWKEAERLGVQVMEIRKRVIGDEHPDTLSSMAHLALTYQNQGWQMEAEQLDVQVMEMRKRVLQDEHPNTLSSMACLASTYDDGWRQKK